MPNYTHRAKLFIATFHKLNNLMMKVTHSSENVRKKRCHVPEVSIFHSHRYDDTKSQSRWHYWKYFIECTQIANTQNYSAWSAPNLGCYYISHLNKKMLYQHVFHYQPFSTNIVMLQGTVRYCTVLDEPPSGPLLRLTNTTASYLILVSVHRPTARSPQLTALQ